MVNNITVTPTISTGIYTSGDCVGGLFKFKPEGLAQAGYIHSATIGDKAAQEADLSLIFFSSKPSGTFTDNAAIDPADADLALIIGVIDVSTYKSFNDNSLGFKGVQSIPFYLDNESQLYCTMLTTGTPTYVSTSDLVITLGVIDA